MTGDLGRARTSQGITTGRPYLIKPFDMAEAVNLIVKLGRFEIELSGHFVAGRSRQAVLHAIKGFPCEAATALPSRHRQCTQRRERSIHLANRMQLLTHLFQPIEPLQ